MAAAENSWHQDLLVLVGISEVLLRGTGRELKRLGPCGLIQKGAIRSDHDLAYRE